jgi:hypothetical protein
MLSDGDQMSKMSYAAKDFTVRFFTVGQQLGICGTRTVFIFSFEDYTTVFPFANNIGI